MEGAEYYSAVTIMAKPYSNGAKSEPLNTPPGRQYPLNKNTKAGGLNDPQLEFNTIIKNRFIL